MLVYREILVGRFSDLTDASSEPMVDYASFLSPSTVGSDDVTDAVAQ